MVRHPIHIARKSYRGRDSARRLKVMAENAMIAKLEDHINKWLLEQTEPFRVYTYGQIASRTGHSLEVVRRICYSIDCGGNGFTAIRHDLSADEAWAAARNE